MKILTFTTTTIGLIFLKKKKKSHTHHIIPFYRVEHLNINPSNTLFKVINAIDEYISIVPFYFSLIISFCSLLLLFFIFLHKYDSITSVEMYFNFIPVPNNTLTFMVFYSSLIFYVFIFFHSLFKFFIHVFSEVRSRHIYTAKVEVQNLLGITLFILSETMLFFSFFWAFFHSSLTPGLFVGNCWPPLGITTLNPWHIPFLNTCILLMSGITVNWFFFTLKRFSYITSKDKALVINKSTYNTSIIYNAVFKFLFVDLQVNNFKLDRIHPFFVNNVLANFYKSFIIAHMVVVSVYRFAYGKFIRLHYLLPYNGKSLFSYYGQGTARINFINSISLYSFSVFYNKVLNLLISMHILTMSHLFNTFFKVDSNSKHMYFSLVDNIYFMKLYAVRSFEDVYLGLLLTMYLGLMFLIFQFCEYEFYADFSLDNIYGTVFYSLTLLHGFHVYVGLFSLAMCYSYFHSFKLHKADMTRGMFQHFWIVFAVWYWHFVDIVWIFLFCTVYIWGS